MRSAALITDGLCNFYRIFLKQLVNLFFGKYHRISFYLNLNFIIPYKFHRNNILVFVLYFLKFLFLLVFSYDTLLSSVFILIVNPFLVTFRIILNAMILIQRWCWWYLLELSSYKFTFNIMFFLMIFLLNNSRK